MSGADDSEGEHDDGVGEIDDAAAALDYLERECPGLPLWAAGFSFGARTVSKLAIRDERIQIGSFSALSGPIGARGNGWIGFDGRLDLEMNAGPLEGLQATAGTIGTLTGLITDRLATYVVTGSVQEPRVVLAPLGIRFSRPK